VRFLNKASLARRDVMQVGMWPEKRFHSKHTQKGSFLYKTICWNRVPSRETGKNWEMSKPQIEGGTVQNGQELKSFIYMCKQRVQNWRFTFVEKITFRGKKCSCLVSEAQGLLKILWSSW
jgi:hypothetical protein